MPVRPPRSTSAPGAARAARAARAAIATLAIGVVASCDSGSGPPSPQASNFRALHTILGGPSLTVVVDGRTAVTGFQFGELTNGIPLAPGDHTVQMNNSACDTCSTVREVLTTAGGVDYTAFVIDSAAVIDPVIAADAGAAPAPGRAALRLADFAAHAPALDAYRSEPDSTGLLLTSRPFSFRAVTPYFQGAPGDWTVVISSSGKTDTLLATGPIALAAGQARTVALLDSAGGKLTWRLVPDRN